MNDGRGRGRGPHQFRGRGRGNASRQPEGPRVGSGFNLRGASAPASMNRVLRKLPQLPQKEKLEDLMDEDSARTLLYAVDERNNFKGLLDVCEMRQDKIILILHVVYKGLQCEHLRETRIKLLTMMESSTWFMKLLPYSVKRIQDPTEMKQVLKELIYIFKTLFEVIPSKMPDHEATYSSFERAFNVNAKDVVDDQLMTEYHEVRQIKEYLEEKDIEKQEMDVDEGEPEGRPPDNFRELEVYPTTQDLKEEPSFLRRNKQVGSYMDVDDYLDTQFRLLKEDFIAPLREGIDTLKFLGNDRKKYKKNQNLRVYEDVKHLAVFGIDKGTCHRVQFNSARLARVNWVASKRLVYGSMVALSRDFFETAVFATVVNREPKLLAEGKVDIRFVSGSATDQHYFQTSYHPYVMVETTAYFESYIHVLKGLQQLKSDNFPMEKYIVKCDRTVSKPEFLGENGHFDVSSICQAKSLKRQKVSVRDVSSLDLGLDDSQFKALKLALCNEFSLIQGPPGTGKTFVGLKIAEVILNNMSLWSDKKIEEEPGIKRQRTVSVNKKKNPMLVVCYTNHALDQFLEGILQFDVGCDIVRVGSRSKSEIIQGLSLNKKKDELRSKKEISRETFFSWKDSKDEMLKMRDVMNEDMAVIEGLQRNIIHVEHLKEVMSVHMYEQFEYVQKILRMSYSLGRDFSIVVEWLGFDCSNENPEVVEQEEPSDTIDVATAEAMMEEQHQDDPNIKEIEDRVRRMFVNSNDVIAKFDETQDGEWEKTAKQRRKEKHALTMELRKTRENMTDEEVSQVGDIWSLTRKDRWRLYRHWIQQYKRLRLRRQEKIRLEYDRQCRRHEEMSYLIDKEVLETTTIIGMTTTGAARYLPILKEIGPKVVIIEEAAEVLEGHIVTSLSGKCQQLILIGDHKQLRPNPTVYKLARDFKLEISLFERMINNKVDYSTLELQHRMRPQIAKLVRTIYPDLKNHEIVDSLPSVKGVANNLFFFDHKMMESTDDELSSKSNKFEAQMAVNLTRYFLQQGYESSQITVLTLYTGQMFQLKKLMPRSVFEGVRVTSVDNYQGEENDIIILSLVRSNTEASIGFVGVENRICVALSRAKCGLYVLGNFDLFKDNSTLWHKLVLIAKTEDCFGSRLHLRCQNHPEDKGLFISGVEDFNQVPEGGCMKPCEFRLKCGHVCPKVCHPKDMIHEFVKCTKPCPLKCKMDHPCQGRCSEECRPCIVKVTKTMPGCGHSQVMPCSVEPQNRKCETLVTKVLDCGHSGEYMCGATSINCYEKCPVVLECGHNCKGSCHQCVRFRLHLDCEEKCTRYLICNHLCTSYCLNCPPCEKECPTKCVHSKCPKKCGQRCKNCQEPCGWNCEHFKCDKKCWEICQRPKCDNPCDKLLDTCGHECCGLCQEDCPKICRICNKDELETILCTYPVDEAGDEETARVIQLANCKHIFEVNFLDKWMAMPNEGNAIGLKSCPQCKTLIVTSNRYSNEIKKVYSDVNKVKKQYYGSKERILKAWKNLSKVAKEMAALKDKKENIFVQLSYGFGKRVPRDFEEFKAMVARYAKEEVDKNETETRLVSMQNVVQSLKALCQWKEKAIKDLSIDPETFEAEKYLHLIRLLNRDTCHLQSWILKRGRTFSDQNMKDFNNELYRLKLVALFVEKLRSLTGEDSYVAKILKDVGKAENILFSGKTLTEQDRKTIKDALKILSPGLNISENERIQILNAMGLRKGHWYKCPNGHVYAITECGGAMVEANCPECGATIGGGNHRLRSDNAVATEMDGARHSVWSDHANMNNFDLDDLL